MLNSKRECASTRHSSTPDMRLSLLRLAGFGYLPRISRASLNPTLSRSATLESKGEGHSVNRYGSRAIKAFSVTAKVWSNRRGASARVSPQTWRNRRTTVSTCPISRRQNMWSVEKSSHLNPIGYVDNATHAGGEPN